MFTTNDYYKLCDSRIVGKYTLPSKSLGLVRFFFVYFLKKNFFMLTKDKKKKSIHVKAKLN